MALTKTPIELSSTPGIVDNSNATAITIDSSENVMVNRTSVFTTAKMEIQSDASDASTLALNSIDTDGSMLELYKAGSIVGSIGGGATFLTIGSGTGNVYFQDGVMAPTASSGGASSNGVVDIGTASSRFKDSYFSGDVNATNFTGVGDGNTFIGMSGSDIMRFSTGGVERLRVNSDGDVGIGLANANHRLQVTNSKANFALAAFTSTSAAATEYGPAVTLTNDPNDTTRYFMVFQGASTIRLIILSNGNVQNTNNSYAGISDVKLKENIADAGSQWDDLKALRVRKYSLKEENSSEPTQIGVIAQEVEAAGMAGLVYESPNQIEADDGSLEDTGEVTKIMKYSILYMKAVKALQEAMERIETLEAKVQTLENN